jgi:hypothetical protein
LIPSILHFPFAGPIREVNRFVKKKASLYPFLPKIALRRA